MHQLSGNFNATQKMNKVNETAISLGADYLEIAIDLFTENEIVKEIPILGSLIKLAIIKNSISDRILIKKLEVFLKTFNHQNEKNKLIMIKQISKADNKKKIGEQLILLIDKFSDFEKPEMLAIIFSAYLKNEITLDEFFRMGQAINLIFIDDLKDLITNESKDIDQEKLDNYLNGGFSVINRIAHGVDIISIINLRISEIGEKFIKIMRDEKLPLTSGKPNA